MKKITLIYDFLKELGGLERMLFFHANVLSENNNVNLLFSYVDKDKQRITKELELKKIIKISEIGRKKNEIMQLALSLLFPSRIKKIKSDLLISYSFMSSRMAYKKKKLDGTPYISVLCHPPNFLYPTAKGWVNNLPRFLAKIAGILFGPILRKNDRESIRNADLIIAISKYTAKRIKSIYGIDPIIIYPQISNFFKPISKTEKNKFIAKKNIKMPFLFAHGRIIPDKNYKILINMMKEFPDLDLIISGTIDKKYYKELKNEAQKLGLQNKIKILGRISREDLLGYYNCAKLFLTLAMKEDFGLTIVEAIACRCPVIAWDDGAGPSEVINRDNGLLAKPYDNKDFISKIKEGLRKKWNGKKISDSVKKFSEQNIGKQFIKAVNNLNNPRKA